jgi:ribosomal protein S18 acetylase RimI-like enzyme
VEMPLAESTVEIQVYNELPEPLRDAARALARASFRDPDATDEERAENRDRFSAHGDAFKLIVAVSGGDEVVGFAVAYRRTIRFAGWPITLGGIGDVCVAPECRRQGLATRLTLAAIDELRWAGCDVAYLCAALEKPGLTELYERAGFRRLQYGHTYLGASGRRYLDHDGMIAPILLPQLFEAILRQPEPFDIGQGNW